MALFDIFQDKNEYYYIQCDTVEVFELGETWQGTARVHGAGRHISTDRVSYSNSFTLCNYGALRATPRDDMRFELHQWLSNTFSLEHSVPDEALVLNPSENCLSFEGFAQKVNGKWMITSSYQAASHYVAFKLLVYKEKKKNCLDGKTLLGNKELSYLFMDPTTVRVSVDGFEEW